MFSEEGFAQVNIIPRPAEITVQQGMEAFVITPRTVLVVEQPALQPSADFFNNYLKEIYGFSLKTSKKASSSNIVLSASKINNTVTGAYEMVTGKESIIIKGNAEACPGISISGITVM